MKSALHCPIIKKHPIQESQQAINYLTKISALKRLAAFQIVAVLMLLGTTVTAQTWTSITPPSGTTGYVDIDFIDANNGALGMSSGGDVAWTTNGAASWSKNADIAADMYSVDMVDVNTIFAIGGGGERVRTLNGGATWDKFTIFPGHFHGGIRFATPSVGWAADFDGRLYKTTNSGTSWTLQTNLGTIGGWVKGYVVSTTVAYWPTHTGKTIKKTTDGTTWSTVYTAPSANIECVTGLDANNVWAGLSDGTIVKTTDGGANWTSYSTGVNFQIFSIDFVSANEGWVVGTGGRIFYTGNGGVTWTQQTSGTTNDLYGLSMVSSNLGFVCGNNQALLKFTNCSAEINLQGGSPLTNIVDGDVTPSTTEGTDFGTVGVGNNLARTFTIQNTGTSLLTISSITSSNGVFTISGAPSSVAAGSSATFTVTFAPTAGGVQTGTITVNNNDCDEAVYDFAVTGTGCVPPSFSTCPSSAVTANTSAGQCSATVNYTVTATGSPTPALTYSLAGATTGSGTGSGSGSTFNKGNTTVTVTAASSCGANATCTFTVTVTDNEPPVITCAANVTVNNTAGLCTGTATLTLPTVVDNCPVGLGNALDFEKGDLVTASATVLSSSNSSQPYTIEFWIKSDPAVVHAGGTISQYNGITDPNRFSIGITADNFVAYIKGTTTLLKSSAIVVDNQWHHVSFVKSGNGANQLTVYVDGVAAGTGTDATAFQNTNVRLGELVGSSASGMNGRMDELRIWDVARTQSQIVSNMNLEVSAQSGLKLLYHFNQGIGGGNNAGVTTLADASGNANNGTLSSFALTGNTSNWVVGNIFSGGVTNDAPAVYPIGLTAVTWTVTDGGGNTATCQQTVTVIDNQVPVLTAPANQTFNVIANTCAANYTIADPIADNCTSSTWGYILSGATTATVSGIADGTGSGAVSFNKGVTMVTLTGVDASGNLAVQKTFTVTVNDNIVPTLTCPANQSINVATGICSQDLGIPYPALSDNCAGPLAWSATFSGNATGNPAALTAQANMTNGAIRTFNKGATTVTLSATDAAGNNSTVNCTFTVTVVDNEPPTITCPADITVNNTPGLCTGTATLASPVVSDNCYTTFGNALAFDGSSDLINIPSGLGQSLNGTNKVTVEAMINPTVMTASGQYHIAGDYYGGNPNYKFILRVDTGKKVSFWVGNSQLVGNTVLNVNQWYHVAGTWDGTTMRIYVNGVLDNSKTQGGTFNSVAQVTKIGYGALSEYFNGIIDEVRIWNVARTATQIQANYNTMLSAQPNLIALYHFNQGTAGGDNTAITTATDDSGNAYDGTLSTFTLMGTTSNFVSGMSTGVVSATNNHPSSIYANGANSVTWTATDAAGNTATCLQTVTVVDTEVPVLTAPANQTFNVIANTCAANYTIADPITDICPGSTWGYMLSGATTATVTGIADGTGSGAVSFNSGLTTVTLTGVDAAGNAAVQQTFTVTVTDNQAPTITCPSNTAANNDAGLCSAVVSFTAPVGTDNCPGATTAQTGGLASGAVFPVGITTNTFTVTAANGQTATCAFTVTVSDNQVPTITCPANITANNAAGLCSAVVAFTAPTGTDNCSGPTTAQTGGLASGAAFPVGTTTNTFTVTAANGQTGTCAFTVTVNAADANVTGNSISIADGDNTPATIDGTDFGLVPVSSNWTRTFTIQNTGTAPLTISSITSSNALFVVNSAPTSVSAGGSANFTVTFSPVAAGLESSVITINNGDCDESIYDFAIQGTGLLCAVTPPTGTNIYRWTNGSGNGLWSNAANWLDNSNVPGVPGAGATAFFACSGPTNATLDINTTVAKIIVDASYPATLQLGAQTLSITQQLTVPTASQMNAGTSLVKLTGSVTMNTAAALYNLEVNTATDVLYSQNTKVSNNLTITSVDQMYGNTQIQVSGNVVINDIWGQTNGGSICTISLVGATDQSISGTGNATYLDISKTGGNVLLTDDLGLASGKLTGTGLLKNMGGKVSINNDYTWAFTGTADDLDVNAGSANNFQLLQHAVVNNTLTITSVGIMYGDKQIQVSGNVVINDIWAQTTGGSICTISLVGATDQSISGTGNASYLDISKTGGNVLLTDDLGLASGKLTGTGLLKNVGGKVSINNDYIWAFTGTADDLDVNAGSANNFQLLQNAVVNNTLTITSVSIMYGNKQIQVSGNVVINDAWATSGASICTISLVGSTDQSISGSGNASYLDISKTAGDVLLTDDLGLAGGTLTGTGLLKNTGGKVAINNDYTWAFTGTADDLVVNAGSANNFLLQQDVVVNNTLTITSVNIMYGNKLIRVPGDIIINDGWAPSGASTCFVTLVGTADQNISGTGPFSYFNYAKPSGNALFNAAFNKSFTSVTVTAGTWNTFTDTYTSSGGFTATGGNIMGRSTLNGNVTFNTGSSFIPGSSPGCVTINGNLTMNAGSTLNVEIQGFTACTEYDQTVVNGTITINGATLVTSSPSALYGQAIVFVNDATDAIAGTKFAGAAQGVTLNIGGANYKVSYTGGTGNDFTLTSNLPPVAVCQNRTLGIDANCQPPVVTVADINNGSSDPDGDPITLAMSPAGPFTLGITNVTLTVTDSHNATSTCAATVSIVDNTPPTITCPGAVSTNVDAGQCSAIVTTTDPVTSDLCSAITKLTWTIGGATTGSSPATGINNLGTTTFSKGISTVTYTVTEAAGNTATCSFDITVVDNIPPTVTCAADVTINNTAGLCTGTTTLTPPAIVDNCPVSLGNALDFRTGDVVSLATPIFSTSNASQPYTIEMWVKVDPSNNAGGALLAQYNTSANAVRWAIRLDATNKVSYWKNGNYLVSSTTALDDNIWHHIAFVKSGSGANQLAMYVDGVLNDTGTDANVFQNTNTVLCDFVGSTAAGLIGAIDELRVWNVAKTPAQIAAGKSIEMSAQSGLILLYHFNQGTAGGTNTGVTTLNDASGNGFNGTLSGFALTGATSNWVTGAQVSTATSNAPAAFAKGTNTVTWTCADGSGNTVTCTQTVTVVDNQVPVLTAPANQTFNTIANTCAASYTIADPIADNCTGSTWGYVLSGATTATVSGIADGTGSGAVSFNKGVTTVTLTGVDASGNLAVQKTFTVTVNDNIVPTLTCPANQSINTAAASCSQDYGIPYPTLADNCAGPLTWSATFSGNATGNPAALSAQANMTNGATRTFNKGVTTVTLSATDASGNNATVNCTFTVTVVDNVPPVAGCQNVTVILDNSGAASIAGGVIFAETFTAEPNGNGKTTLTNWNVLQNSVDVGDFLATTGKELDMDGTPAGDASIETKTALTLTPGLYQLQFVTGNNTFAGNGLSITLGTAYSGTAPSTPTATVVTRLFTVSTTTTAKLKFTETGPADAGGTILGNISLTLLSPMIENGSSDNCGIASYTASPSSFTCANIGVNTTTLTVTDAAGNTSTCTATVTVVDNIVPTLTAPANQTFNVIANTCAANYTIADPINDNCTNSTWGYTLSGATTATVTGIADGTGSGAVSFNKGVTTVTLTGVDASGNNAVQKTFTVTVNDNIVPTVTCPANQSVNAAAGSCSQDFAIPYPTLADNCAGPLTWNATFSGNATGNPAALSAQANMTNGATRTFNKGVTTVTLSATDAAGNNATVNCTFTVTVVDNTPPTITCASDITVNNTPGLCSGTATLGAPTASDNCPNITTTGNAIACDGINDYLESTPLSLGTGNFTLEFWIKQTTLANFPVLFAQDQGGVGIPAFRMEVTNGSNTLLFAMTDATSSVAYSSTSSLSVGAWTHIAVVRSGNTYTTFMNGVASGTATIAGSINQSSNTFNFRIGARRFDASGAAGNPFQGIFDDFRVWNVARSGAQIQAAMNNELVGNESGLIRYYKFNQGTAGGSNAGITTATATTGANATLVNFALTGTTSNWVAGTATNLIGTTVTNNAPAIYAIGNTTVTWTATDAAGNSSTCQQTVTVNDNEVPVLTAPANQSLNVIANTCAANYTIADPISDNCTTTWGYTLSGATTATVTGIADGTGSGVVSFNGGVTTVTLTGVDASGNAAVEKTFTVTVTDNIAPSITCPVNIAVNNDVDQCGAAVTYTAPVGTDNCSGATTLQTGGLASGASFPIGITTNTFRVTAANGQTANCTFTVTVTDNQAPVITCPMNIAVNNDVDQCSAVVSFTNPVGTDNCPSVVTVQTTGLASGAAYPVGITTNTFRVTAANSQTSTCTFTVTVTDNQAPTITCPANIAVNNDAGQCGAIISYTTPAGTDNCSGATTTQTGGSSSGASFPIGVTTNTFKVTAANGQTATCVFTVTVTDNQAPVITCPVNIAVGNDAGQCNAVVTYTAPMGTDNCPGASTARMGGLASGATYPLGVTTNTFTVTASNGQTTSCSFTVTVSDTELPLVTCPANKSVLPVLGSCVTVVTGIDATYSDNCAGATLSYSSTGVTTLSGMGQASGQTFNPGVTTVTYTATDAVAQVSTCSFTVTMSPCVQISGNIKWENNNAPVKSADVKLESLPALTQIGLISTDVNGNYTITPGTSGDYRVRPEKNTGLFNGVTSADATRIQQHITNNPPLVGPYKRIAADVNKSNSITTADATLITQALAGNPSSLAIFNTSWRFVPASYVFPTPTVPWGFPEKVDFTGLTTSQTNVNFIGMKIGDVNGSANPLLKPVHPLVWLVNDAVMQEGEMVEATFRVGQLEDIASFQFALEFDTRELALEDIQTAGPLSLNADNFGTYSSKDGEIRAVWAVAKGETLKEGTKVFTIRFKALNSGRKLSNLLHLEESVLHGAAYNTELNEAGVELVFTDAEVSGTAEQDLSNRLILLQNQPNPTTGHTTIGFVLPQSCEAQLRIVDVNGRTVTEVNKSYPAGYQTEAFDLSNYPGGVLYYELTTPYGSLVKKMIVAR